jgi:hypothetical protein
MPELPERIRPAHPGGAVCRSNPRGRESSSRDTAGPSAGTAVRMSANTAARNGGGRWDQTAATWSKSGSSVSAGKPEAKLLAV